MKEKCAFGEVTRNMVVNLDNEFKEFKLDIKKEFNDLKETNTELYNHLSSRVPPEVANKLAWLTGILGTITGGVIVGVIMSFF